MLVCISVILLLCFFYFSCVYSLFSVSLPDLANKDVHIHSTNVKSMHHSNKPVCLTNVAHIKYI